MSNLTRSIPPVSTVTLSSAGNLIAVLVSPLWMILSPIVISPVRDRDVPVAAPIAGVVSDGEVAKTNAPLPCESLAVSDR